MKFRRALWLVAVGWFWACFSAAAEDRQVAGEALVLKHPPINKSIGNPVHCLTFLNDGALLATGATSGVYVWDASSGKLQHMLDADERSVDALASDRRGTCLIAGGAAGNIKAWDARTFQPLASFGTADGAVHGAVGSLAISPDSNLLATASPNGQLADTNQPFAINLWHVATGQLAQKIEHPRPLFGSTALAFLPDSKQFVSAQDRTLRLIDVPQGKVIKTIDLPQLPRTLGRISLDGEGRRLVTGAFEPKLRLWDIGTWKQTLAWDAHDKQPPPRRGVSAVTFSPDGKYILSGGLDGMVALWDAASGRRLLELDGRGEATHGWITDVAMTSDNRMLAASHFGGIALIWRIAD